MQGEKDSFGREALDTLIMALDQPILHRRLPQVFEAIAGVRGEPIQLPWLRHRVESPPLLVAISQLSSNTPQTSREDAILAVKSLLADRCTEALNGDLPPQVRDNLQRLHERLRKTLTAD